jgi:hypothetical protein
MLQDGERLSRLWRYVFVQMLDDYTSVLRHAGVPAAARMWASPPRSTGDIRVDAAFAAMAEYLARRDGWAVPSWARLPGREAWPWWFVTDREASIRAPWLSRRLRSAAAVSSLPVTGVYCHDPSDAGNDGRGAHNRGILLVLTSAAYPS